MINQQKVTFRGSVTFFFCLFLSMEFLCLLTCDDHEKTLTVQTSASPPHPSLPSTRCIEIAGLATLGMSSSSSSDLGETPHTHARHPVVEVVNGLVGILDNLDPARSRRTLYSPHDAPVVHGDRHFSSVASVTAKHVDLTPSSFFSCSSNASWLLMTTR